MQGNAAGGSVNRGVRGSSRASKQTGKPHEAKQDQHDERNPRHDRIPRLVFGPDLQKDAILPALRPVRIFLVIPKHLGLSSLGRRQGLVYNRPIQRLRHLCKLTHYQTLPLRGCLTRHMRFTRIGFSGSDRPSVNGEDGSSLIGCYWIPSSRLRSRCKPSYRLFDSP